VRRFLHTIRTLDTSSIVGLTACLYLAQFIVQIGDRVGRLESRGWTPVDDVATLRDLDDLERRIDAAGVKLYHPEAAEPGEDPAP
jgi:hypothetical protein